MLNLPIPYSTQEITPDDISAVTKILKSTFLTQGPAISALEESFATYTESNHCVAVANGTAALHLGILSLGVAAGEKVITSPLTFAASANCILYAGARVIFCDIDKETGLMDLEILQELIDLHPDCKGVIPVNYAGMSVNTEKIRKIIGKNRFILEDACHSPGGYFIDSKSDKVKSGSNKYADAAIFSFHAVKHIAAGEGGMLTCKSEKTAKQALTLRTHGITKTSDDLIENHGGWYYEMQALGFNYRLTDIQAALALSQLKRADQMIYRRKLLAERYHESLVNLPIQLPVISENIRHAYHLFVIRLVRRTELYDYLKKQQILCQIHYIPVHLHPYYQSLGFKKGQFPNAESFYETCLSIPLYPSMTDGQQDYVINKIKSFF